MSWLPEIFNLGYNPFYQPPAPNPNSKTIPDFSLSKLFSIKKKAAKKKLALALITTSDPNSATEGMEEMFMEDFSGLPDYQLYTERASNLGKVFKNLRDYSSIQSLDALILAFHGSQYRMNINFFQQIDKNNSPRLFKDYGQVFSPDAVILLYSCATGAGRNNLARSLATTLKRKIVAPKLDLFPETDLKQYERVGEFGLDEDGRVSFKYDNFRLYKNLNFKGENYPDVLAPFSYKNAHGDEVVEENAHGKDYFLIL